MLYFAAKLRAICLLLKLPIWCKILELFAVNPTAFSKVKGLNLLIDSKNRLKK